VVDDTPAAEPDSMEDVADASGEGEATPDPGSDPATDPSADPASDPASDPLADPAADTAPDTTAKEYPEAPSAKNQAMFDEDSVVEFRLTFTEADWQKLLADRAAGVKDDVHCGFEWEGEKFADASCRSKGNPEYWKDEKKPQFTVHFNHWDKNGRFHGLRKLNLEANPYTSTPIRDRLGMWLMREAGLDASRVNHARVYLNGAYLGLYMNIEPLDREFLEGHFADPTGNLYENGYQLKTNEDVNDQSDLWALEDLVDAEQLGGDHAAFQEGLAAIADVHQIIREMAAEVVLPTADNFTNGSWNFYWYDCPGRGFVVLPWDLDTILDEYSPPDTDLYEWWGGEIGNEPSRLRLLVNEIPAWRKEFEDALVELRDGPYAGLGARATWYCAQVRAAHEEDPNRAGEMEDFDAGCARIPQLVTARIAYIKSVLGR
jgi:hypothetical protein